MTTDTDSSGNSSESGGSGDGSGGRPAQLVVELHPPRLEPPAAYTVAIELLRSYEGFGRVRAKIAPLDAGEPEPPAVVLDAHWTNLRSVPGEFALEGVRVRGPFRVTLTPVDAAKVAATTIGVKRDTPDDNEHVQRDPSRQGASSGPSRLRRQVNARPNKAEMTAYLCSFYTPEARLRAAASDTLLAGLRRHGRGRVKLCTT